MKNICKRIKIDKQYKFLPLEKNSSQEEIDKILKEEKYEFFLPLTKFFYDSDFYTAYNIDEKIFNWCADNLNNIKIVCPVLHDQTYYKTYMYRQRFENMIEYTSDKNIVKPFILFKNKSIISKFKLIMV